MDPAKRLLRIGVVGFAVFVAARSVQAEDIRGTIVRTLMLSETSQLVGDVTCQVTGAPCIAFGAPNITLNLNGFTITGSNDSNTGCKGTQVGTETGINTNGQSNVGIRGPGLVQRFQGDGILFIASAKGWVQGVTTTTNCMSGIRINPTSSESASKATCPSEMAPQPLHVAAYESRATITRSGGTRRAETDTRRARQSTSALGSCRGQQPGRSEHCDRKFERHRGVSSGHQQPDQTERRRWKSSDPAIQ